MSYNRWLYGYANPVRYTDPSGERPNLFGLCPDPPSNARSPFESILTIIGRDMYVYCGEFKLTAYQFVTETGYDHSIMATGDNGTFEIEVSYDFAKDVELNGTGRSFRPEVQSVCDGGYFSGVTVDTRTRANGDIYYTFNYKCGKGKDFVPNLDYGKVVAADKGLFGNIFGAQLYIPKMCGGPGSGPCSDRYYNPFVTFLDEGGAIKRYRIDVFTGEGPGPRATGNTPANLWIAKHEDLGKTQTDDGRSALGPTPVYQLVREEYHQILYEALFCSLPISVGWGPH